jgi:hypothetical protein
VPRRGRHARHDPDDSPVRPGATLDDPQLAARVDAMLAELAAEPRTPIDGFLSRFESQSLRIGLMVGGAVGFALLLFGTLVLIGMLLF